MVKLLKVFLVPVVILLSTSLIAALAQEQVYHVKPDSCTGGCLCPSPCLTLSQYAQNVSDINNQSVFMLARGQYYLNRDFIVNGTSVSNFFMIGNHSETVTITCSQNSSLSFNGFVEVTIQNVAFVSCGGDTLPGINLINIDTLKLIDLTLSKSSHGALFIEGSTSVLITNFSLINNRNSVKSIANIQNSREILLHGVTTILNNSIGEFEKYSISADQIKFVFQIWDSALTVESVNIANNSGSFGIVGLYNSMVDVNGNWLYEWNQVCKENSSSAGMVMSNSSFRIHGNIKFFANSGYTTSISSTGSNLTIFGDLDLTENHNGSYALLLKFQSTLKIINGSFVAHDNDLSQTAIYVENSEITISDFISIFDNPITPIVVNDGIINLNGHMEFHRNARAIIAMLSNVNIDGNSSFWQNNKEDNFIYGTLAIVQTKLTLSGRYFFSENQSEDKYGAAIFGTFKSTILFRGSGTFNSNQANNGGAIYISQQTRIELEKGTRLLFENNKAVKGGAIFILTTFEHTQCTIAPNECLFQLENGAESNTTLTFRSNKAEPGASIIHVNFDNIPDYNSSYPALDDLNRTVIINPPNTLPAFASDSYWFCFCTDNSPDRCTRNDPPLNITATRGKPFSFKVRTIKFYGEKNMSEPIQFNLVSALKAINRGFTPETSVINTGGITQSVNSKECKEISFQLKSSASNEIIILNVGESYLDVEKTLKVNVMLNKSCPIGFPLNYKKDSCECDNRIKNFLQSCEITDTSFQKRSEYQSYWLGPTSDPLNQSALIWYESCPYGYCKINKNFTFINDDICTHNRSGLLCGMCEEGTSLFLGGDECGNCSDNSHLTLLILFGVLGVLLVIVIFLTQMTVATGTINGLIFYVNILSLNRNIFFPEEFFPGYTVFISWLNLNFGITICFYDGMDQIAYTGLQFVFPVYIWLLMGLIIALCRFSDRVSKMFGNSDPVAVLATITLLSYNSLVQNIINVFYFSTLNYPDKTTRVWRYNGNINFATGQHVTLIIVALVFLILFFVPYTLTLFSAQILQKSDWISKILRRLWLQPFIHAYLVPFKPAHRYWVGLCLMVRAILSVIFTLGEDRNINLLVIITTCVVAISMFKVTGGIYSKNWLDLLEVSFMVNLAVLSAATLYANNVNALNGVATYISITFALLTFVGLIVLHIKWRIQKLPHFKGKFNISKRAAKKKVSEQTTTEVCVDKGSSTQSEVVIELSNELREPLLETEPKL